MTKIYPRFSFSHLVAQLLIGISLALPSLLIVLSGVSFAQEFDGTGRPPTTGSGASRGSCPATELDLMPLVPIHEGGGWTIAPNPSLWFYSPYTFEPDYSLRLVLRDPAGNPVYEETYTDLNLEPGVVSLSLPADIALASTTLDIPSEEAFYEWFVLIACDAVADRPSLISGTIRRVDLGNEFPDPATTPSLELSDRYAEASLWYDALSTLGNARLADPNNPALTEAWNDLLTLPSVGLDVLVDQPIQSSCCDPTTE